ncbi:MULTISPECIES: hypothetical protein [Streptomyces]|nr:hypothetical protein [Streptomyces rimosus]
MGGNGKDDENEGTDDREYDRDQDFGKPTDPDDPNVTDGDPHSRR